MADFPRELIEPDWSGELPDGLIAHMITLIEHAERSGLSAFEAKLIGATETLIEELNEKGLAPHNRPVPAAQPASNVVEFPGARRAAGAKPQRAPGSGTHGRS